MVLVAVECQGLTPSHWHTNGRNFLQLLGYFWRGILALIDPGQTDSPYNTWVSSPQWLKHFSRLFATHSSLNLQIRFSRTRPRSWAYMYDKSSWCLLVGGLFIF